MNARTQYRKPLPPASIAAVASGLLFYFSIGLNGIGWLAFLAPIPALIVSFRLSFRATLLTSFVAFLVGLLSLLPYLMIFVPPLPAAVSAVAWAAIFALAVALSRTAAIRLKPCFAVFAYPLAWTAFEFVRSIVSENGTAGSFAYTQASFLPLIQIASITGIWGITFVLSLVPSVAAFLFGSRMSGREMIRTSAAPALIVGTVLLFGLIRLSQPRPDKPLMVGLAATDTTIKYFRTTDPAKSMDVIREYADRAADLARFGARVVVFPEKFAAVTAQTDSAARSLLGAEAREHGIIIVAGLNYMDSLTDTNVAAVFLPDGRVLNYDKRYLVPGFEAKYYRGDKPLTFNVDNSTAGVEICKDMDFPSWSRIYGKLGAGILLVPAWDFTVDGRFHMRMALLRGVEEGFALVRCAQQGLLTVSDYRGQIISRQSTSSSPEILLISSVSPGPGRTFYSYAGDWFGWLDLGCALLLLAFILMHVNRTGTDRPPDYPDPADRHRTLS